MICSKLSHEKAIELYRQVMADNDQPAMKYLCANDLFFLLTVACKRKDVDKPWLYDRCREVEANPDGYLDLWAREHYKSTIITFGLSIQNLLKDPDHTSIGILSHTRPNAKGFLKQIKREFEHNTFLQDLFPDVLYKKPQSESPSWSDDGGLTLKRKTNPKEANVEAWGLVDGQPTGKHFTVLVYDDVVTKESVSTPEQIKKTTEAWELSQNLGAKGGRTRYIGTRYHLYDTYAEIISRQSAIPRVHAATRGGKYPGEPVFLTQDELDKKRRDQGPYTFSCQQLQDPVADKAMGFKEEWLKYYDRLGDTSKWNKYLIVDPASKQKKTSDYTVMEVIALAPDGNYYLLDALRDRLSLTQRAANLFRLHRKHKPLAVGYEEYGAQADREHMQDLMERENYRFNILPLGGAIAKVDRIKGLIPKFEQAQMYMPKTLRFVDYEGRSVDYIEKFKDDEYLAFPVSLHDDMLDCRARILDPMLGAKFPKAQVTQVAESRMRESGAKGLGWMR